MIAKFTTDIPQLSNWGEPLLLGPGSIHVAHTLDERIPKRQLEDAVGIYRRMVTQLLEWGRPPGLRGASRPRSSQLEK